MNKLWVCRSTAENITRAEKYEYFKANDKYCLVITDETPDKMAVVAGDAVRSLTAQDWAWIKTVGEKIKAETEYSVFQQQQKEFLERFEEELKERMNNAGNPDGDGTE